MLKSSINHKVYIFNCICLSVHSAWLFCFEWSLFLFTITANSACSTNLFSEISASEHPPPCWPQAAPPQVPEDQGGHRRTHHPPPGEEAGTHPTQVTPPINLCGNLSILQFSLNTIFHGVLNSLLRDSTNVFVHWNAISNNIVLWSQQDHTNSSFKFSQKCQWKHNT